MLLALLLLAGCGGSGSDGSPATSGSSSAVADSPACDLLTAKEREALAGSPVDTITPIDDTTPGGKSPVSADAQCRWTAGQLLVQVSSLPAPEWVATLPTVLDRLEASGTKFSADDKREIAEIRTVLKSSKAVNDQQACGLFSSFAEIGGAPQDSDSLVSYIQVTPSVLAISAQICRDGIFVAVVDAGPQLTQSAERVQAAQAAVTAAHTRALAAG